MGQLVPLESLIRRQPFRSGTQAHVLRLKAEALRAIADEYADQQASLTLRRVADDYEWMAGQLEREGKGPPPPAAA